MAGKHCLIVYYCKMPNKCPPVVKDKPTRFGKGVGLAQSQTKIQDGSRRAAKNEKYPFTFLMKCSIIHTTKFHEQPRTHIQCTHSCGSFYIGNARLEKKAAAWKEVHLLGHWHLFKISQKKEGVLAPHFTVVIICFVVFSCLNSCYAILWDTRLVTSCYMMLHDS